MRVQGWLKLMHAFDPAATRTFGDPHRLGAGGEPTMCPAYEPGDVLVICLAGSGRCPAIVRVTDDPWFDPEQSRWGWRTPVETVVARTVDDAPSLEEIGVLRRSIARRSRMRLDGEQLAAAERGLRA